MSEASDWASTNWTPRNIVVAVSLTLIVAGLNLYTGMALEDYRSRKQGFQALKPSFDGGERAEGGEIPKAGNHGAANDGAGDHDRLNDQVQPIDGPDEQFVRPRLGPSDGQRLRTIDEGPGQDVLDRARLDGEWMRHDDGSWGFAPHMKIVRIHGLGGAWTVTPDGATWVPEN
jgi:hypothetical protein